jgi:excisionase family DNA binding protein
MTNKQIRVSKEQGAFLLGLSLNTLENRIATGKIRVIRDGRRVFILLSEIDRYAKGESE